MVCEAARKVEEALWNQGVAGLKGMKIDFRGPLLQKLFPTAEDAIERLRQIQKAGNSILDALGQNPDAAKPEDLDERCKDVLNVIPTAEGKKEAYRILQKEYERMLLIEQDAIYKHLIEKRKYKMPQFASGPRADFGLARSDFIKRMETLKVDSVYNF